MRKMIGAAAFGVFLLSLLLFRVGDARAADPEYPTKPVTLYIAWGAGGNTDLATRAIAQAAGKHLGQAFVPVNRPGAGGTIGAMSVMNAPPDGYSIGGYSGSAVLLLPHTPENPYHDLNGYTLIMNFGKFIFPLLVRADAPYKTWSELIQYARQHPKGVSVGITGARSMSPMGIALWTSEQKEKVEFTYIALKSSTEVLNYTLGGHINVFASSFDPTVLQFLKEGKLRLLGYLSEEKAPGFENYPTFKELYGEVPPNLAGIWAPKGIPEFMLKKLDDAFAKAVKDPDFLKVMAGMSMPVVYMNRQDLNRFVQDQFPKVGETMKILRAEEAKASK